MANIKFRFHALQRMFERKISESDVLTIISSGKRIEDYPNDQPYPSCLQLGFVGNKPIHVVFAVAEDEECIIVITVYEPDLKRWHPGFETRR